MKTIKRGFYVKGDKEANKLVKKARQSDVRREKLDTTNEKLMKSKYEYSPKDIRKLKMGSKKINEDEKREMRRDERVLSKKK